MSADKERIREHVETMSVDEFGWDCGCGAGMTMTIDQAASGCPIEHPAPCRLELTPRVERVCRLDEDECARRCTSRPGGCDIYGQGLEPDGRGCRVAGRTTVEGKDGSIRVELDLAPIEGTRAEP